MSKAMKALNKACSKLRTGLYDAQYLVDDCELLGEAPEQDDFNWSVDDHDGDELKAIKAGIKAHKADLKRATKTLEALTKAIAAVSAALPAAAEARLEALEAMTYTGEDEPDDDSF